MARIEHRRRRPGPGALPSGVRRLPVPARAFALLGAVVAAVELWPAVDNLVALSVTEWWADIPGVLLPAAARSAAMVALPAAVGWASPRAWRANPWLWKGAVIVAAVQLLRHPAEVVERALVESYLAGDGEEVLPFVAATVLGLGLGLAGVLGIWALGEGLKDAGARSRLVVPASVVVALATGILLFVPVSVAGVGDLTLVAVANLAAYGFNVVAVLVAALLAGRAAAGALARRSPVPAWRAGAVAALVLLALPLLALVQLLAAALLQATLALPFLAALVYLGWPLFTVAVAAGLGRLGGRAPAPGMSRGFAVRGSGRFVPAVAARA